MRCSIIYVGCRWQWPVAPGCMYFCAFTSSRHATATTTTDCHHHFNKSTRILKTPNNKIPLNFNHRWGKVTSCMLEGLLVVYIKEEKRLVQRWFTEMVAAVCMRGLHLCFWYIYLWLPEPDYRPKDSTATPRPHAANALRDYPHPTYTWDCSPYLIYHNHHLIIIILILQPSTREYWSSSCHTGISVGEYPR